MVRDAHRREMTWKLAARGLAHLGVIYVSTDSLDLILRRAIHALAEGWGKAAALRAT